VSIQLISPWVGAKTLPWWLEEEGVKTTENKIHPPP
jgi:hypothetical protein